MSFLKEDPLRRLAEVALRRLQAGEPGDAVESDKLDCKEDPSRRDRHGRLRSPGPAQSERAAESLADAAACMANSGGGVLVVGVDDKTGTLRGTDLDPSWLRGRMYELCDRRLTCAVEEVSVAGTRLLVVIAPQAQEPVRVRGKIKHRVDRKCVEMDASEWVAGHLHRLGHDWSAQPSGVTVDEVRPAAIEVCRRFLRDSGEQSATDLAAAEAPELLRRLGVVDTEGVLSNAGALLLTADAGRVLLDYRRREQPGGDSLLRLDRADVSLLEVLQEAEQAIAATNRVIHIPGNGLAVGQIRAVPEKAIREALANAAAHRDWLAEDPIVVESVGDTLVVQSPGGFVPGVDAARLLTTPARTRNPHLADLLRRLRIAEREGIGVDRMYRELVRVGHRPPDIAELPGPHVRCVLAGGEPDVTMLRLMTGLEPPERFDDLDIVLLTDRLRTAPTVDAPQLAATLQKQPQEAVAALDRGGRTTFRGSPLVVMTTRTARFRYPEYRLGDTAREHFGRALPYYRASREETVERIAELVRRHGQVRNADLVELFGFSTAYASQVLRDLTTEEGGRILRPGREPNIGRHAHYLPGPGFPD